MGGKIFKLHLRGCPTIVNDTDFCLVVEHSEQRAREAAESQLPSSGAWLQSDVERLAANDMGLPHGVVIKGKVVE